MITKNKVVGLAYELTDDKGEVIDSAEKKEPFYYLHGMGQIVPGLEKELEGLKEGDKKKVKVPPAQGYGEVDTRLQLSLEKSKFPKDAELEEGMQFEADLGDEEEPMVFTIKEVKGDKVKVDGNHPLAGMTLNFDVEVVSIRDATTEELQHGHAHHEGMDH